MLDTLPHARQTALALRVGVGVDEQPDMFQGVLAAAAVARAELDGAPPHLALVLTTAPPPGNIAQAVRGVLGPVGVAGGVTAGLLTDRGLVTEGALVLCISNAEGAASGTSSTTGRSIGDAAQAAARLILAGWPFRGRYPRGVGIAFTGSDSGAPAGFLTPWRDLMGPKMRTLCGRMMAPVVFGASSAAPIASVGCLEAPYLMGLGLADGSADTEAMIHGSADAALTALKWLEGRPARLVIALESVARRQALGAEADREWAAVRDQVREHCGGHPAPCVGWLCEDVAAYGRGVHPADVPGALVVAALGDPARDQDRLT